MPSPESTSLNGGNTTVNLGGDLGPLGHTSSPSAQASWDEAMADAGLDGGGGTDDIGWGGTSGSAPSFTGGRARPLPMHSLRETFQPLAL